MDRRIPGATTNAPAAGVSAILTAQISALVVGVPLFGISGNVAGAATEASASIPMPRAGKVTTLRAQLSAAVVATASVVFTLVKNGTPTALTVTIANGDGTNVISDTAHVVAFDAGDTLSVKHEVLTLGTSVIAKSSLEVRF